MSSVSAALAGFSPDQWRRDPAKLTVVEEKRLYAVGSQLIEAAGIEDFPPILRRALEKVGGQLPTGGQVIDLGPNQQLRAMYR